MNSTPEDMMGLAIGLIGPMAAAFLIAAVLLAWPTNTKKEETHDQEQADPWPTHGVGGDEDGG